MHSAYRARTECTPSELFLAWLQSPFSVFSVGLREETQWSGWMQFRKEDFITHKLQTKHEPSRLFASMAAAVARKLLALSSAWIDSHRRNAIKAWAVLFMFKKNRDRTQRVSLGRFWDYCLLPIAYCERGLVVFCPFALFRRRQAPFIGALCGCRLPMWEWELMSGRWVGSRVLRLKFLNVT